jgi:hypothetical protein
MEDKTGINIWVDFWDEVAVVAVLNARIVYKALQSVICHCKQSEDPAGFPARTMYGASRVSSSNIIFPSSNRAVII